MSERSQEWFEIADLRIPTHVGVTEAERASPQTVAFNIRFQIVSPFRDLRDEIGRTVNYSEVVKAIKSVAEKTRARLIETLAGEVADCLFAQFPLVRVEVKLKKFVVPNTEYVSVKTVRKRCENSR